MKRVALFSLLFLSVGSLRAADVSDITIACSDLHLPAQSAVSALTGIDNFSAAYRARERLMQRVRSLCKRGDIAFVRLVPQADVSVGDARVAVR